MDDQKDITSDEILLKIDNKNTISIKRFKSSSSKIPMILIHGSMENGRIFYSKSLKGFAPYMTEKGFDVYVVDLRGKGNSTPKISSDVNFDQLSVINDLEKVYNKITELNPEQKQIWCTHSWGGVLLNSAMLRFDNMRQGISACIHFGVKRSISVQNLSKFFNVNLGFNFLMKIQGKVEGYVSPRFFGFDSEARDYHLDQIEWVRPSKFVDLTDGFNYFKKAKSNKLPPAIYFAGANDMFLGNIVDVKRFMAESNQASEKLIYLSKNNGFEFDYGHNDQITSKSAQREIYPIITQWLAQINQ